MGTGNAGFRRARSYFFEKYCQGRGIDIGCFNVRVTEEADGFDKRDLPGVIQGDATYMEPIENETYDWVYSSHCLEHIEDMQTALRNWWRILKSGGHLIVFVPHRDYYERKLTLPSVHNGSHFRFFLPFESFPPDTIALYDLLRETLDDGYIRYINECSDYMPVHRAEGVVNMGGLPAPPEWSIEAVIQKGRLQPMFEKKYE